MTDASKTSRLESFVAHPRRALWRLALPVMVGMSLQTIYMIVDMAFVGRVSAGALAALAFNMPIVFLGLGIIFGLGAGVTSVIARSIGAEDKSQADASAEHAVLLGGVISLAATGVAYLRGEALLVLLGVPPDILPLAWDYFSVLAGGYVFVVMSVFFRSILSGEGDTKTPMIIQGSGTILNIFLDPLFIFTLGLGVKGAALATVLSQAAVCLVFVHLLFFKEHAYVTFDLKDFRFRPSILGEIFRVGAPVSFSYLVIAIGGAIFNRILVVYSEEAVAAFQVGARVDHVFLLPVIAFAVGLMTMVGMFYGAKRGDLLRSAVRHAMSRCLAIAFSMGLVFFVMAPDIIGAFTDSEVITAHGVRYLRISVFSYPFFAIVMLTGRALQGMGKGNPALVLSLMRVVLISGPLAYVFAFEMGKPVEWVFYAIVAGIVATALVAIFWLRQELRRSESGPSDAVVAPVSGALSG